MRLSTLKTYLHREQRLLIGLAIGGALATLFIKLAGEMSEGETAAVDIAILKALRLPGDPAVPVGPSWLLGSMRDLTALGGVTVLTLVSLLAVTFLLVRGRWHQALYTAVATGGGAEAGLEDAAGGLAGPEAGEPDLVGQLAERLVDVALEAAGADGHGQADLVAVEVLE